MNKLEVKKQKPTGAQFSAHMRQRHHRHGLFKTLLVMATMTLALISPAAAQLGDQKNQAGNAMFADGKRGQFGGQENGENGLFEDQKRITAMNVLLPISNCAECRKVRYELSATNGCYQWSNSHPQLVQMTDGQGNTLDSSRSNDCISTVYLEAKTLRETKSIILITAKDANSGTVLKCSAKVGLVHRLDITTRSKQFSVNSNQHIGVVGYDDEENSFSSMDGFSFDWKITDGTDIIKKFAALDTGTQHLHRTDYFFIRSLKAGFTTVAVKLEEPGYENVKDVSKRLTVVDPFIILPAEPVYILPTSEFGFTLSHLDMDWWENPLRPINVPNPMYKWSTLSTEIGTIGQDGKFCSMLSEGEADILVTDQNMKNNTAEGLINVVFPYRMEVSVRDITELDQLKKLHAGDDVEFVQAWAEGLDKIDSAAEQEEEQGDTYILIEEHYYRIRMHLFDKDGHKITLTENLRFKSLNLNDQFIEVIKVNDIGSEMVIKTKKINQDTVQINSQYKLNEIIPVPKGAKQYTNFAARLTQDKELIITRPVKISHPTNLVLLPFLPEAHEQHGSGEIWNVGARGGSGTYQWQIVDTTVATVKGSAQIKSVAIGKTKLICRDHKNRNNWDALEIEVAQIMQLTWVEEQIEMKAQGENRLLSLVALDNKARKFTNCTSVRPAFELRGDTFVSLADDSESAATRYSQIKHYVATATNYDLLTLRQRFDEQPEVIFRDQLVGDGSPKLAEILLKHNNFGICAQKEVGGKTEGLARLKASYLVHEYLNGPGHLLESEHAEIAVYNPLRSVAPTYKPYMSDLYSQKQLGQEFQSFETFYEDWKLKLQFGASMNWRVDGGSNFWPAQAENYETTWNSAVLKGTTGADRFSMEALSVLTSESLFELRCLKLTEKSQSQRVQIKLRQASRSTKSLMRPAVHELGVEVHCDPPSHVKLLWAQEYTAGQNMTMHVLQPLPRSRIVHNERTHFVLVNSRHTVRYLVLDNEHQVSFNSSSVLTSVTASDDAMATIDKLAVRGEDPEVVARKYRDDALSGVYDKRTVQFKNITGRMFLKAESTHYLEDFSGKGSAGKKESGGIFGFGGAQGVQAKDVMRGVYQSSVTGEAHRLDADVANQMTIEVVRNVDVEPKFKSLYIGTQQQTYKLRILHGSGNFVVTVNNTALVDIVQKDRDIFLQPKDLGGLTIMVEDLELPQSQKATAELLISDIAKLTLWAPLTLIEKGDEMVLTVSAYDSNMNLFDTDQYPFMRFNIETETMGLRRTGGLQSTQMEKDVREFLTYGNEPGVYQLTAFTFAFVNSNGINMNPNAKSGKIVSEMLRVEVFPILEIYPSDLLITPNMRYTLQIVGGPQNTARSQQFDGSHIEINFSIENTEVATVDRFREVTGHEVGDAILKYEIIQLRTQNHVKPQGAHEPGAKGMLAPIQPTTRIVSKKTVQIRVRLVTSIEIPFTHQRQIYSGSLIKMMAVLKHDDELFHHGIAPISYTWSVSESRVLDLDLPTKQELAQVHGIASNLAQTSRYVRDNEANKEINFFTAFNSSSIYARGDQEGETSVKCKLAIEYPNKYRREQNWFTADVNVKVTDRLTIQVPQYSIESQKETHMYLVPPQTLTRIETNKQTKLKLGYSQQSVFDYSTKSYRYEESTSPIIELVNDEAIRTFDKHGKVTLLVEEGGAFSDQMVMLNVKVADVFTIATMRSYDALSLPLGSSVQLPLHLQDDRAHKFADKITGVAIDFHLSHPKVVHVSLNQFNETITVQSLGSGDCNIFLFLKDHPHIYDVIRVRVSGIVQPASPVYIHLGGEINFRVESTDNVGQDPAEAQVQWSSSNPGVLSVAEGSGQARGLREGKADVMLSNHLNAASIVHVSKISDAQLDQKSQLIIKAVNNNDQSYFGGSGSPEYRVRIRLFLERQPEETMPTVQFDGITLIRHHIDISCQSDNEDYVEARGEVNDLEGFFCVMSYVKGADTRAMPKFVKITATVAAKDPETGKTSYSEQIIDFEMQLQSEIQVETKFKKEIKLCRDRRTEKVSVYSSSDFKVSFDYGTPEDDEQGQFVLHQVSHPLSKNTSEYILSVQVPVQVSHAFEATMTLSHQFAQREAKVRISFEPDQDCGSTSILAQAGDYFSSPAAPETPPVQEQQSGSMPAPSVNGQGAGWQSYFIFFIAFVMMAAFVLMHFCEVDFMYLYDRWFGQGKRVSSSNQRRYHEQYNRYQTNLSMSGDGIRESRAFRKQPLARDNTFSSYGGRPIGDMSSNVSGRQQKMHDQRDQRSNMHFDDLNMRRQQTQQMSASRHSRFDSIQDSARYY